LIDSMTCRSGLSNSAPGQRAVLHGEDLQQGLLSAGLRNRLL
jgi:hypothetical protein